MAEGIVFSGASSNVNTIASGYYRLCTTESRKTPRRNCRSFFPLKKSTNPNKNTAASALNETAICINIIKKWSCMRRA